jgi:hypothetical protein
MAEKDKKPTLIYVKSALPPMHGGDQTALFERDEAHPGGEAFVSGNAVVQVAETSAVASALANKRLVKVSDTEGEKALSAQQSASSTSTSENDSITEAALKRMDKETLIATGIKFGLNSRDEQTKQEILDEILASDAFKNQVEK